MYNRYIRDDKGTYTRIPQEESRAADGASRREELRKDAPPPHRHESSDAGRGWAAQKNTANQSAPRREPSGPETEHIHRRKGAEHAAAGREYTAKHGGFSDSGCKTASGGVSDGLTGILRHFLDRFHMDRVDTGDLLLLGMLFFLFREDADEELLTALGLLLIL